MNDNETITISLKEYKELLITKGKYEELKNNQLKVATINVNEEDTKKIQDILSNPWSDAKTSPYQPSVTYIAE